MSFSGLFLLGFFQLDFFHERFSELLDFLKRLHSCSMVVMLCRFRMVTEDGITFIPFLFNIEEEPVSESHLLESLCRGIVDEIKDSIIL